MKDCITGAFGVPGENDHVPLAFQRVYRCSDERSENGDGRKEESGDYLVSCMQMIWFCVPSGRPKGNGGTFR